MAWTVTADELSEFVKNRDTVEDELKQKWGGVEGLTEKLKSDIKNGLDLKDKQEREAHFGVNVLPEKPPRSFWSFWFEALQDHTLIILGVASVVSIILGLAVPPPDETRRTSWIEGTAILIAVLVVSGVTSGNDFMKDKKFRQLSAISEDRKIKVIRNGQQTIVSTKEILVGDVVSLETGDFIPADMIYIHGQSITVDESPMTGEPDAVHKTHEDPFFLSGCMVQEGVAHCVVAAVGIKSQWGQIKANLEKEETKTPLQENLEELAENIGKVGLVFAIITFVGLVLRWGILWYGIEHQLWEWSHLTNLVSYFIIAITIVVVAVPEGLPLAVTLSLAYSMIKMMKDQNLVRHLAACETMGGATQICSDKTGTLTQNRMTVTKMWISGERMEEAPGKREQLPQGFSDHVFNLFTEGVCINSSAYIEKKDSEKPEFIGAKTECALLVLSNKLGVPYEKVRKDTEVVKIFPFSSKKKKMSTIVKDERGDLNLYCKGASEVVLDLCTKVFAKDGTEQPLPDQQKEELMAIIQEWAGQGLRTLSLTYTRLPNDVKLPDGGDSPFDKELTLIAIVGIEDPVRPEVPSAVATCKKAGITVRMLTGDNILTAKNIGKKCGIYSDDGIAIEGPKFRKLTRPELDEMIPNLQIIARCSPEDKLILVRRLRDLGEVVAVTGDGTNDSPALREADVGFSMGITGTEVAKDASDIILLDDNFSSIVKAVLWGRNVYDSIRKFVQFQLTVNIVAVIVACIGALSDGESPLKAVQLLWVNLIMDTLAALALATEAPTSELLERPPYGRFSPLITYKMWRIILGQAFYQLFFCFLILYYGHHWSMLETCPVGANGLPECSETIKQTIIFNAFVWAQIFNEFNARRLGDEKNMFSNLFGNYIFVGVLIFTACAQVLIVEVGGNAFQTTRLNGKQWAFCFVVGAIAIPLGFLIRCIPTPPEPILTPEQLAEKNAKRQKGEEKPLLVSEKDVELVETEKGKKDKEHVIEIEKRPNNDDDNSPEQARHQSLPPQNNWDIAAQVLTQVRVISAFRKPVRGSTYGANFK